MNKKVAIVIVNWNGFSLLTDCLTSVCAQTYYKYDVYFVDNNSKDESVAFVKATFPKVKIISLKENTGFAKGSNEGIREAFKDPEVEFIVLLNNDTIVELDWLKSMVEAVDYSQKIDMVSSKAFFTDGNVQTIGLRFEKDLMGDKAGGLSIGYGELPETYTRPQEVFCPSGVSALYTRRLLEEVGLLDEDFFAYCEDLDLGIRARKKGYRCIFAPDSKLVHLHSQSSGGAASPLKAYLIKRNNYLVAIKNFPLLDLLVYPFRDALWNIKNLFKTKNSVQKLKNKIGSFKLVFIQLKVYFSVFLNLPKTILKRWN